MQLTRVATSLPSFQRLDTPSDVREQLDAAVATGRRDAADWHAAYPDGWAPAALTAFAQATVPHPPTDVSAELARLHRMQSQVGTDAKRASQWLSSAGQPSGRLSPDSWWTKVLASYRDAAIAAHGPSAGARDAVRATELLQRTLKVNDDATFGAKYALPERRPYTYAPGAKPPAGGWAGQDLMSHPSGHASRAFAAATIMSRLWPEHAAAFQAVARGVAHSRLLEDMHFAHDVAMGARIGTLVAEASLAATADLPILS